MVKAFSLLELLLVTALIISLAIFSFAFYARFLTQNGVANLTDQIVQDLRKAQSYAMESRKSNTSGWGVNYVAPTPIITLYQGVKYATRNTALDEKFSFSSSITVNPSFEINYSRITGLPTPTPIAPITITISGQGTTKTVTINSMGVVSR